MAAACNYEKNPEAFRAYLRAYGDGFQYGCRLPVTDYSPPPELAYTNTNPVLRSAEIDGFVDGESAALRMIQRYLTERRRQNRLLTHE